MAPSNRRRQGRLPAPEQTRVREPKPEAPKKPRATALETTVEDAANRPGAAKPKKPSRSASGGNLSKSDIAEAHQRASHGYTTQDRIDIDSQGPIDRQIARAERIANEHNRRAEIAQRRADNYRKNGNERNAHHMDVTAEMLRERGRRVQSLRDSLVREQSKNPGRSKPPNGLSEADNTEALRRASHMFTTYDRQDVDSFSSAREGNMARATLMARSLESRADAAERRANVLRSQGDEQGARSMAMGAVELRERARLVREHRAKIKDKPQSERRSEQVHELLTKADLADARRSATGDVNRAMVDVQRRDRGTQQREHADRVINTFDAAAVAHDRNAKRELARGQREMAREYARRAEQARLSAQMMREHRDALPQADAFPSTMLDAVEKAAAPGANGDLRHKTLEGLSAMGTAEADQHATRIIHQMVQEMYATDNGKTSTGHKYTATAQASSRANRVQGGYEMHISVQVKNARGTVVNEVGQRRITVGRKREVYHAHFVVRSQYRDQKYGGDYIRGTIWAAHEQGFDEIHVGAASTSSGSYNGVATWPRLGFEIAPGYTINTNESTRTRISSALGKPWNSITAQDIRDNYDLFSNITADAHMVLDLKNLPPREQYVRGRFKHFETDIEVKAMKKKRTYVDKKKTGPTKPYVASWDDWVNILDNEWPEQSEGKMSEDMLPKAEKPKKDKKK